MAELNEPVDLEGSETDIEANPPESEDSYFLGWKRRNLADNPAQNLLKKALKANVPFIVSLHLLVFNLTLSIALGSLVWKSWGSANSGSPPSKDFAAGELLYSSLSSFPPPPAALTATVSLVSHIPSRGLILRRVAIGQDIVEERVERAYIGPGYSTGWIPSPYQGWPSDESDRLWKKYEGWSLQTPTLANLPYQILTSLTVQHRRQPHSHHQRGGRPTTASHSARALGRVP